MTLLLPLGLLGLLSLAVLILIYVLRPNYQQKLVSSTFVWKLSLKYRKNRLPISRLRNLLILIFQILLLACMAVMMAQPAVPVVSGTSKNEKVAIIDASASMMVASENQTRFERALDEVQAMANETLSHEDGVVSVILADSDAHFVISRLTSENAAQFESQLSVLRDENACSYGSADIDGAAELAEQVLQINSEAEVLFYTGTEYINKGSFNVVDVSADDDWNAAVLNVTPVLNENVYSFSVEVGCFGVSKSVTVSCEIFGVNGSTSGTRTAQKELYFSDNNAQQTVTFASADFSGGGESISSYTEMYVHIDEEDSFQRDNWFNVYGGTRPVLKVQYSSSSANNFYGGVLRTARTYYNNVWDIQIDQVLPENAKTEGYDLYIFEHTMPEVTPADGVVIFSNPDKAPEGSGFNVLGVNEVDPDSTLASGTSSPITQYMDPTRIKVAQYSTIENTGGYDELFYYNGVPVLLAKNQPDAKIVILAINLNKSTFSVVVDFSIMMFNIFDYYLPATLTGHSFEVGETVSLNARGESLSVSGPEGSETFDQLPATIVAAQPGDYTVTQTNMAGATIVEQFFVHIPNDESNITRRADRLPTLYSETTEVEGNEDLTMWFAIAALVLLCAEWILHSRENL